MVSDYAPDFMVYAFNIGCKKRGRKKTKACEYFALCTCHFLFSADILLGLMPFKKNNCINY